MAEHVKAFHSLHGRTQWRQLFGQLPVTGMGRNRSLRFQLELFSDQPASQLLGKLKLSHSLIKHNNTNIYICRSAGRSTAPRIFNLEARWRCMMSFTLRSPYPPGKSLRQSLDRRISRRHIPSELCGEAETRCFCRELHPYPSVVQVVAQALY